MIGNTDVDAVTLLPVNNPSKDSHLFNLTHRMIKLIKHLWAQQQFCWFMCLASWKTHSLTFPPSIHLSWRVKKKKKQKLIWHLWGKFQYLGYRDFPLPFFISPSVAGWSLTVNRRADTLILRSIIKPKGQQSGCSCETHAGRIKAPLGKRVLTIAGLLLR